MNQRFFLATLCILAITAVTCRCIPAHPHIPDNLENTFQELIPINDMNESFQIAVEFSGQENLNFGSEIKIIVRNLSDQQILFLADNSIRLFIVIGDKWVEIQNNVEYYGDGLLLRPDNEQGVARRIATWVCPALPSEMVVDEGERVIVRIVVIGEFLSNGERTGIPVAAYTDVYIFQ